MYAALKQCVRQSPRIYNLLKQIHTYLYPTLGEGARHVQRKIARRLHHRPDAYFLQIGAHDGGEEGDPLHDLIQAHPQWEGLFVEPIKEHFEGLRLRYHNRDRFQFANVAIAESSGNQPFYTISPENCPAALELPPWADQMSSFSREHILQYLGPECEPYISAVNIPCLTLADLLNQHHAERLDLVTIDAEGADHLILAQIDFEKYSPAVVLYEHKHLTGPEQSKSRALLQRHGYHVREYGGDTLAVAAPR